MASTNGLFAVADETAPDPDRGRRSAVWRVTPGAIERDSLVVVPTRPHRPARARDRRAAARSGGRGPRSEPQVRPGSGQGQLGARADLTVVGSPDAHVCPRECHAQPSVERLHDGMASAPSTAAACSTARRPTRAPAAARRRCEKAVARRVASLRKEGDYWTLGWDGAEFHLQDRLGLRYLAVLVGNPAREFLATDLVTMCHPRCDGGGGAMRGAGSSAAAGVATSRTFAGVGALLDRQAALAYRRRLEDLRAALIEARRFNDLGRVSQTQAEIDALTRELARGLGLGGRRRTAGSAIERARVSVTRALWGAVRRIQVNEGALGRHLAGAIRTGTFCSYTPDPESAVSWRL